ncbi:MAG: M48 family metallopeptidase [Leptolyngbyaceae bacterium]|nr:M48 family metallopeptidase [Leptolyngbyaceae bacterium]
MPNFFSRNFRRSQRPWFYPLLSCAIAFSLFLGTALPTQAISWSDLFRVVPQVVQFVQLSNLSDRQEVEIGQQINNQLLGSEFKLYRNPAVNEYVNQIGQRLAAKSDRPTLPYKFQIVEDKAVNAFATMGGFVYVTTGLMQTADNEAQLASVIGHEIGHIGGRHLVTQMRETAIQRGIATATGLDRSTAVGIGVELALNRPNSRQAELDADQRGLQNLRKAGYAPSAMIAFMEKLLKNSSNTPGFLNILSTHPATAERISALKGKIDPARANIGDGLSSSTYRVRLKAMSGG